MRNNLKRGSSIKVKEDMIMPIDPGPSIPGEIYQTPMSMPGGMDTFSLVGPLKKEKSKKKKKSRKKATAIPGSKVLNFNDFLKSRK